MYNHTCMCGRYTLTVDVKKMEEEFQNILPNVPPLKPSYNIAPSRPVPVLLRHPEPKLDFLRWGLIPSWAKDPEIGNRMINARKETLIEKPSFRVPFKNQRCLVLADGFYEWKGEGLQKIPYYIRLKSGRPFGFAGLWSHWTAPNGGEIYSCAIITGEPNELLKPIHNRMPMILPKEKRNRWLDPENHDTEELMSFLEPYPAEEMEAHPVSRLVNSPANDTPECVKPIAVS